MHVPKEQNFRADMLSNLDSSKKAWFNHNVIQETISIPSIEEREENTIDITLTG